MMTATTDISERGLEDIVVASLTGEGGYCDGQSADFIPKYAVDAAKLARFLTATQPEVAAALRINEGCAARDGFLNRLHNELESRGVVDILRGEVKHLSHSVRMFYGTPTPGNDEAVKMFGKNIFSVTRQLRYQEDGGNSLDIALFVNGLPVVTMELKNRWTGQSVKDAVQQYRQTRSSREPIFRCGRCAVHFAVDDREVEMCAHLRDKDSVFMPFNKGRENGAGNPPNPGGMMTDYLWKEALCKSGLVDILENYAQMTGRDGGKEKKSIFPRYHQLRAVRMLLADSQKHGAGRRHLIQHSAGSGKSNSIAWLAHQLVDLKGEGARPLFDSIVIVTDRNVLDSQIDNVVRQFTQVSAVVGHAETAAELRDLLKEGKKIITTTVQKFPHIAEGAKGSTSKYTIIIDEAHSSQGGSMFAQMNAVLNKEEGGDEDIKAVIEKIAASRKMLKNASYFAFTATPKSKTLELFGGNAPREAGDETEKAAGMPSDVYTMRQAIDEGFILDVVQHYTPVARYFHIAKTIQDDPEFDAKKARKKLRKYVDGSHTSIEAKAAVMLDHFHNHVRGKIGGEARAMVVAGGVEAAVRYHRAITEWLRKNNSPYKALVAFAGDKTIDGDEVSESRLNQIPAAKTAEAFRGGNCRILIVAEKYQTGYDEPLLHTMYVDKPLAGVRAVQTLSRLNRARPGKNETFVLDFGDNQSEIAKAFDAYYQTTILSEETDPNKLHDLKARLDNAQVYGCGDAAEAASKLLTKAPRGQLDALLDKCVESFNNLDDDAKADFKAKAREFVRFYAFLASILPFTVVAWEELNIFLVLLIPKLPPLKDDDFSRGILDAVDMKTYRAELEEEQNLAPSGKDGELKPAQPGGGGKKYDPRMELLTAILKDLHDKYGNWKDREQMEKTITEEIPKKVLANETYRNALGDEDNARLELKEVLRATLSDFAEDQSALYDKFHNDKEFAKWLEDAVYKLTRAS